MDFSNFDSKDMLIMECTHVDASGAFEGWSNNVNMDPGFIWSKIALKLVGFNNEKGQPWAVFAVYTDEMNSQHGTGLFKVYVDAPAKLTVRKWLANQRTIAQANERYSSNINSVFTVFSDKVILSRLVDTFFSRISPTMQLPPKHHSIAYVLPWAEGLHWQSRSSGCSNS